MSPLQPRRQHPADRNHRARRQPKQDAEARAAAAEVTHFGALSHVAYCEDCRFHLFKLWVEAHQREGAIIMYPDC